jgi:hypothetical protein
VAPKKEEHRGPFNIHSSLTPAILPFLYRCFFIRATIQIFVSLQGVQKFVLLYNTNSTNSKEPDDPYLKICSGCILLKTWLS